MLMLNNRKPSDLSDEVLLLAWSNCGQLEKQRAEAAKHTKFDNMKMPLPNPQYTEMKTEIENELKKRNLNYE